jgi:hypothetical protein
MRVHTISHSYKGISFRAACLGIYSNNHFLFLKRKMMRFLLKSRRLILVLLPFLVFGQKALCQTKEEMFKKFRATNPVYLSIDPQNPPKADKLPLVPTRSVNELQMKSRQKPESAKLDDVLQLLQQMQLRRKVATPTAADYRQASLQKEQLLVYKGNVRINAYAVDAEKLALLSAELLQLGFNEEQRSHRMLTGWLPVEALTKMNNSGYLQYMSAAQPMMTSGGVVSAQSDVAQLSNLVRQNRLVNGSGIKVGIISNSYNLENGAAQSVLLGDLPGPGNPNGFIQPVQVLREALPANLIGFIKDEGRAMAEIIHDIAPGASLVFYAPADGNGPAMATAFRELAKAGCNIIVDDIVAVNEPFFQDNLSNAVSDSLVDAGVTMIAAAGNFGAGENRRALFQFYESPFKPVLATIGGVTGYYHNFENPNNGFFPFIPYWLNAGPQPNISTILQWDSPWGSLCNGCQSSPNDLFLLFFDANFNFITFRQPNLFGDAITTSTATFVEGPALVYVAVFQLADEQPLVGRFKIANFTGAKSELESSFGRPLFRNTPTVMGGDNSAKGISVASSAWYNTPAGAVLWNNTFAGRQLSDGQVIASTRIPLSPILGYSAAPSVLFGPDSSQLVTFSSLGGSPVIFDRFGNRFTQPQVRQNPLITGADGVQTSFFGRRVRDIAQPFFFGTSASAPGAAGAASLLLAASKKTLTPTQIKNYFNTTALDMDNPYENGLNESPSDPLFSKGYDFGSGHGLLQADKALEAYIRDAGIAPLTIEPVCLGATEGTWLINNPNGFAVSITLTVSGARSRLQGQTTLTSGSKTFLAPPGNFNFYTNRSGFVTSRITWRPATGSGSNQAQYSISQGAWTSCGTASRATVDNGKSALVDNANIVSVYPNPAPTGHFNVAFTSAAVSKGAVEILDVAGNQVYREERVFVKGINNIRIDVPGFAKGQYYVKVIGATVNKVQKVVLK